METKRVPEPFQEKLETHEMMFLNGDIAAPALAGIRQSEIADKLEAMQNLYSLEAKEFPDCLPGWLATSLAQRIRKRVLVTIARTCGFSHWKSALDISRHELKALALAHATELNSQNAAKIQADFAQQHRVLAGDLNEFHHFLLENFPNELHRAVDLKQTLFDVAKRLLLERK